MGSTLKGKNLFLKEQILYLRVDPTEKVGKKSRVASPVNTPIYLNTGYKGIWQWLVYYPLGCKQHPPLVK